MSFLHQIHIERILLASALAVPAFAEDAELPFRPEKATSVRAVDTTKANSITLDVSIFGDEPIGSMFIFWDAEQDLSEEMKKILTTRDFARDEFFMQNIDREQFEQERQLQLFEDKKKEYFKIFPEDAFIKDPDAADEDDKDKKKKKAEE